MISLENLYSAIDEIEREIPDEDVYLEPIMMGGEMVAVALVVDCAEHGKNVIELFTNGGEAEMLARELGFRDDECDGDCEFCEFNDDIEETLDSCTGCPELDCNERE